MRRCELGCRQTRASRICQGGLAAQSTIKEVRVVWWASSKARRKWTSLSMHSGARQFSHTRLDPEYELTRPVVQHPPISASTITIASLSVRAGPTTPPQTPTRRRVPYNLTPTGGEIQRGGRAVASIPQNPAPSTQNLAPMLQWISGESVFRGLALFCV